MSTDKTLADVQPGGSVRLGDQAHVTISDDLLSSMAYAIPGAVETTDKAKAVAARVVEIYLSAQPSPAMESMGKRKLHQLQGDGFIVNGVAIFNPETGRRGLVDNLGYVEWMAQPSPGGQDAHEMADALKRIAAGSLSDYEGVDADELHILRCAKLIRDLAARQPVGEPVAIPEGWALVDLAEYTVLPQIPTTAMMDAGWPIGEQITDRFDVKGAYADLIAEHDAKGEGITHGPSKPPAQAVDLGQFRPAVCAMGLYAEEPEEVDEAKRLLALLDSQAVGNG